ncbi:hypothetical protein PO909_027991 [Leuciscus waleckii]
MEGDPVTLNIDLTRIQSFDQIMLKFGLDDVLIAAMKRGENQITLIHSSINERFRDRLKLDEKTGSLTITNTRTTDSGLYKVTSKILNYFSIFSAHLPVPIIIIDCPSSSSSGSSVSKCSLVCSVLNVSHCLDDSYSCVVNNPISNQTQHLDISGLCPTHSEDCRCCGFTEAVIRLALSALVGVATVAVLVYEFRSRSLQQKKREQTPSSSD